MEILTKIATIIGLVTGVIISLVGLLGGVNHLIKESSLVANTVWELKHYGFKRKQKYANSINVDNNSSETFNS